MVRPDTVSDDAMLVEDPMSVRSCADMCGATTDVRFGPIAEIGSGLIDYFIRAAEQRRRPTTASSRERVKEEIDGGDRAMTKSVPA